MRRLRRRIFLRTRAALRRVPAGKSALSRPIAQYFGAAPRGFAHAGVRETARRSAEVLNNGVAKERTSLRGPVAKQLESAKNAAPKAPPFLYTRVNFLEE